MSFTLHGIPVSSGIAIGYAHLISHTVLEVVHYVMPKYLVHEEVARFDAAMESTRQELAGLRSYRPHACSCRVRCFSRSAFDDFGR